MLESILCSFLCEKQRVYGGSYKNPEIIRRIPPFIFYYTVFFIHLKRYVLKEFLCITKTAPLILQLIWNLVQRETNNNHSYKTLLLFVLPAIAWEKKYAKNLRKIRNFKTRLLYFVRLLHNKYSDSWVAVTQYQLLAKLSMLLQSFKLCM